jgi:glycosyltransferase involved in cell wall biosynthesis
VAGPAADGLPLYVEVSPLLTKHLTGIGRFAARLVEALAHITPLRLITTIQGELARNMRLSNMLSCGQDLPVSRADVPAADEDVGAWARRLLGRPRCRHDPHLAARCPVLYTMLRPAERHFRREFCLLHDFTPLLMPKAHVRETRANFGALFARNAALCDKLVANSYSTQADASWLCAARPEDIVVAYPGPTLCVHRHACPDPVARRENAVLVVSTLEPRKNGPFLFRWFLDTCVLDPQTELWWVGPNGWLSNQAGSLAQRSACGRKIKFLGVVADRRLCQLYRQAAFAIYPSLYEGFPGP